MTGRLEASFAYFEARGQESGFASPLSPTTLSTYKVASPPCRRNVNDNVCLVGNETEQSCEDKQEGKGSVSYFQRSRIKGEGRSIRTGSEVMRQQNFLARACPDT